MMRGLTDAIFTLGLSLRGGRALKTLYKAAQYPEQAQERVLKRIIAGNAATAFGRAHGFSRIRTLADFRAKVPLHTYEDLRPYVERQIDGEAALVAETPVMYARTSGTLGVPKLIPVTPTALKRGRTIQAAITCAQMKACDMFSGRILVLAGARREDSLPDGTPIGSVTGLIYETMPALIRRKYVVPPEVFSIDDAALKYAVVAHLALLHADLTAVSTANPSTFLRLRDYFKKNWAQMIADVRRGHLDGIEALSEPIRTAVKAALRPDPARAAHLDHLSAHDRTAIADLWPRLAGVVTWTGGSCAIAAEAVRRAMAPQTRLIEAGYVASELRGTAVVDVENNLAVPLLEDVFFEFVAAEDWDDGQRETLLVHELCEGQDYQVIVTTLNGLYRYVMNDILRAGALIGRTPSLSFMRKGKGFTSITGEKLSEAQVGEAMLALSRELACEIRFHAVLADEAAAQYRVYIEAYDGDDPAAIDSAAAAEIFDGLLAGLNIEYAAKRDTGRLLPARLASLKPGTAQAYRDFHVARGQREAQFKVLTLQYVRDCPFDFAPCVAG